MSEFLRPQKPLQHSNGKYIYPLTTEDQVILSDGKTRLNSIDFVSIAKDTDYVEGSAPKLDADTLGGSYAKDLSVANAETIGGKAENELHVAHAVDADKLGGKTEATLSVAKAVNADKLGGVSVDDYATKSFVAVAISNAQLAGGEGADIDLSGYATKDDINNAIRNIDFIVDSVNGKTGAVQLTAADVGLGNVDNTSDTDKPVSTAQAEAINAAKTEAINVANTKATAATYRGTFTTSGWSTTGTTVTYTQTITLSGLLSTDDPFIDVDLGAASDAAATLFQWGYVGRAAVNSDNNLTAYCYEKKPTVDIPVVLKVVR